MIRLSICTLCSLRILNKKRTKWNKTQIAVSFCEVGGERLATIRFILWRSIRFIQLINCIQMEMIFMRRWLGDTLPCLALKARTRWAGGHALCRGSDSVTSDHRDSNICSSLNKILRFDNLQNEESQWPTSKFLAYSNEINWNVSSLKYI